MKNLLLSTVNQNIQQIFSIVNQNFEKSFSWYYKSKYAKPFFLVL